MPLTFHCACVDTENSVRGRGERSFSHQSISKRAVRTSLEEQLDPMSPIASRGVSVSEFLRKPIKSVAYQIDIFSTFLCHVPHMQQSCTAAIYTILRAIKYSMTFRLLKRRRLMNA